MPTIDLREYTKDIWDIMELGVRSKTIKIGPYIKFTDISDAPTSYTGKANYYVKVNAAENGLTLSAT